MSKTDVIVCWDFAPPPKSVLAGMQRPYKVISLPTPASRSYGPQLESMSWPHPIRKMILDAGIAEPGRVAVMGFSESCTGVGKLLTSADAAFIDFVYACDGIHAPWEGGKANATKDNIAKGSLDRWIAYARLAYKGAVAIAGLPPSSRQMVITHSSIDPIDYVSTTNTALHIMDGVYGGSEPPAGCAPWVLDSSAYPMEIKGNSVNKYATTRYLDPPVSYCMDAGGFMVIGYSNRDASGVNDHIYQAQRILPLVLANTLAVRWNQTDPNAPTCTSAGTSGPGCNPTAPLLFPTDQLDGTIVPKGSSAPPGSSNPSARMVSGSGSDWTDAATGALKVAALAGLVYGGYRVAKAYRL